MGTGQGALYVKAEHFMLQREEDYLNPDEWRN